jgi:hypothetical protein
MVWKKGPAMPQAKIGQIEVVNSAKEYQADFFAVGYLKT